MSDYIISCCSTADLSEEHLKNRDIHYACFHFSLDGKQYKDDLGKTISYDAFYQAMKDGAETKTPQVNAEEFVEYFTPFLEQGKDILHITLSSGISGVLNSANIAKEELAEKFPERKIYVVDSLGASSGYGLLMDKLADLRDEGMKIEELYEWVEQHKLEVHHWFFSTDLTFYVKGGRISKAAGWFGTSLHLCPLMNMDEEGKLIPRYKVRGKRAVIKKIVEKMKEFALDGADYDEKCYISQAVCYEDAAEVVKQIEEAFPKLKGKVLVNTIGTTIGSHTGPGTVALFFWGSTREGQETD